jgi:hypothetical protein
VRSQERVVDPAVVAVVKRDGLSLVVRSDESRVDDLSVEMPKAPDC